MVMVPSWLSFEILGNKHLKKAEFSLLPKLRMVHTRPGFISMSIALSYEESHSPWLGCWSITGLIVSQLNLVSMLLGGQNKLGVFLLNFQWLRSLCQVDYIPFMSQVQNGSQ
jgi:hypothetical protein